MGETLLIPVAVLQSRLSKTVTASLCADFENGFHLTWLQTSQDAHCVTTKQAHQQLIQNPPKQFITPNS